MKEHAYFRSTVFVLFISILMTNMVDVLAQGEDAPFWLTPKVDLDLNSLSPATVKLVKGPEIFRKFGLLQTGENAPSSNYVPSNPRLEPLIPSEDTGYHVVDGGLKEGAQPYGDRKYRLKKLDAPFTGLTLLQTKMGHKAILDGRYSILLSAAKTCYVFVAIDERALDTYKKHGTPAWLEEYRPTGHKLATDEPVMDQAGASYLVFVKQVAAGRIVLGPPCVDAAYNAMYFVFFGQAPSETRVR
jgi:hypothetical protein